MSYRLAVRLLVRLFPAFTLATFLLLGFAGCRSSKVIAITIENSGGQPLHNIEIRYPSASFGVGTLQPAGTFAYKLQATGTGKLQLTFDDAAGKQHHEDGPEVHEGESGDIKLSIDAAGNNKWENNLRTSNQRD